MNKTAAIEAVEIPAGAATLNADLRVDSHATRPLRSWPAGLSGIRSMQSRRFHGTQERD